MADASDQDQEDDAPEFTHDDLEMFYHTAIMLELSIDAMSKMADPDEDSGILLARSAAAMVWHIVMGNTTEEEFMELERGHMPPDDDLPRDNHPGTETRQ